MPTWTVEHYRIPELPGAGRLGRHYRRDSRSAAYPYQPGAAAISSVQWARHAPILDQGDTGSCTGNAAVGALATDPLWAALPGRPALDETLALQVYSDAETIDGDGPYPPNDNGSTGQSVCQAARNRGWISGYTWCRDLAGVLDALQHGPVLLGVNWYSSFDAPGADGVVTLPATARIRGGHEIVARQVDTARELVWADNSWGTGWGQQGRFTFPYTVLERLLAEDGDCAVPLPLTAPAPQPQPVPDPDVHADSADRAYVAAVPAAWAERHHTGDNKRAAAAYAAWKHAKGLS